MLEDVIAGRCVSSILELSPQSYKVSYHTPPHPHHHPVQSMSSPLPQQSRNQSSLLSGETHNPKLPASILRTYHHCITTVPGKVQPQPFHIPREVIDGAGASGPRVGKPLAILVDQSLSIYLYFYLSIHPPSTYLSHFITKISGGNFQYGCTRLMNKTMEHLESQDCYFCFPWQIFSCLICISPPIFIMKICIL